MEEISRIYDRINGHRISTDSRTIEKGDVFIALKGENFDGNKYVDTALAAGAYCCISDDPTYENDKIILVDDSLKCLQQLALYHRRKLAIPILGITGTNGKTTTKELCLSVLSKEIQNGGYKRES